MSFQKILAILYIVIAIPVTGLLAPMLISQASTAAVFAGIVTIALTIFIVFNSFSTLFSFEQESDQEDSNKSPEK